MKRVLLICSLFFVVAIGLGEHEAELDVPPFFDILSNITNGQKAVVLIDFGTKLSFSDEIRNAYSNESVSLFWVHFGENPLPQHASQIEAVGDVVAEIIRKLYDADIIDMQTLELACYGVGCHAAGIIGRKLNEPRFNGNTALQIPTIFALNPTELTDVNSPPKLQPEDANAVVVLHTNQVIAFEESSQDGTHDIYLNGEDIESDANKLFAQLITNPYLHVIPYDFNNNEGANELTQAFGRKEFLSKPGWYILDPPRTPHFISLMVLKVPKFVCQFFNNMKPEKDVNFQLYSPTHRQNPMTIKANEFDKLGNGYFNKSWPTKFIIHGFISGNNDIDDLSTAFANDLYGSRTEPLNYKNLISINWRKGARYYYGCAHQYVEEVGKYAAQFIFNAVISERMDLSTVEVIGHSLGGHVAGWVGKTLKTLSNDKLTIPRIVALDPAGPCYSYVNYVSCLSKRPDLELKRTDANEVIVLHTNSRKWSFVCAGYWGLLGTADIFLNGGMVQRGMENINSHNWAPIYYRFIMNMEKPLIGYTFMFSDADSLFAVTEAQRGLTIMKNHMKPNHRVEIFHKTNPLKLKPGEAIYVNTYSEENSVP